MLFKDHQKRWQKGTQLVIPKDFEALNGKLKNLKKEAPKSMRRDSLEPFEAHMFWLRHLFLCLRTKVSVESKKNKKE